MPISALQRSAFARSQNFIEQVYGVVVREALYKHETITDIQPYQREQLSRVVNNPELYAFPTTIIADAGWALTYDVWAADPAAQDGVIGSAVDKAWPLLVGIETDT